jgi:hypothetical protein
MISAIRSVRLAIETGPYVGQRVRLHPFEMAQAA